MSFDKKYVLAVPNFSEGRRSEVIEAIAKEVKNKEGVKLVSVEPEYDLNNNYRGAATFKRSTSEYGR